MFAVFIGCAAIFDTTTDHSKSSIGEIFSGIFCFPGPLSLPWGLAYASCPAMSYFGARLIYMVICSMVTKHCLGMMECDHFMRNTILMITLFAIFEFGFISAAWMSSRPQLPPKVRDGLISEVANTEKASPGSFQAHGRLMREGYGLYKERCY